MINGYKTTSSTLLLFECENILIRDGIVGLLNSNFFDWYYFTFSDCYHLTNGDFKSFKIDFTDDIWLKMKSVVKKLMKNIDVNSNMKVTNYKTKGKVEYQEFYPRGVRFYYKLRY